MGLLKDDLMKITGLSEDKLKGKLLDKAPNTFITQAGHEVDNGAMVKDSWAYITRLYAPSDNTLMDRMLQIIKG